MILVERPTLTPARCLVTGKADDKSGPYIDLLRDFDPADAFGRMYVSRQAVFDMASYYGLPTPGEFEVVQEERDEALSRIDELEEEISRTDSVLDAIDVIESDRFKARRRAGRKPSQTKKEP